MIQSLQNDPNWSKFSKLIQIYPNFSNWSKGWRALNQRDCSAGTKKKKKKECLGYREYWSHHYTMHTASNIGKSFQQLHSIWRERKLGRKEEGVESETAEDGEEKGRATSNWGKRVRGRKQGRDGRNRLKMRPRFLEYKWVWEAVKVREKI